MVDIANLFTTPEQKKAVVDSLANFGATVERATTQAYDRFQRWFGSAQDRAEQWFQVHVRGITIFFSIMVALLLQLDTIDIFRQLRSQPAIVAVLTKSAPDVLAQGQPLLQPGACPGTNATEAEELLKARQTSIELLKRNLDSTGFDLVPATFLGRWGYPRRLHLFDHLSGILITAGLLTLGAPF